MVFIDVSNVVSTMDGIDFKYERYNLIFNSPVGTSRGTLKEKPSWFVEIHYQNKIGKGECSVIPGLSPDFTDVQQYESLLDKIKLILKRFHISDFTFLNDLVLFPEELRKLIYSSPSVALGLEMALLSWKNDSDRLFYDNPFYHGQSKIPINGLIWMGSINQMEAKCIEAINNGLKTIKIKIGALSFSEELSLLKRIRNKYNKDLIEIRVDANGAFSLEEVNFKLKALAELGIHSIEQPIRVSNLNKMEELCQSNRLPIALDEELIGHNSYEEKSFLLNRIKPQYIVLKPSLHGGFYGVSQWIELANSIGVQWWITSALESTLGLDAIAQFTSQREIKIAQGLGTGSIYSNNLSSPLFVSDGHLCRKVSST